MNRTEALRQAVEHVYSGAQTIDAECIEDALHDLGYEVVPMPRAANRVHEVELPLASTRGLPKRRSV